GVTRFPRYYEPVRHPGRPCDGPVFWSRWCESFGYSGRSGGRGFFGLVSLGTLPSEHSRGDVPQRTVWPLLVVNPPVPLQQHRGLLQAAEQLAVEQFVAQPAVERLAVGVLPRAPRLYVQRLGLFTGQPTLHGISDELRAVVAPQVLGHPPLARRLRQRPDHVL